MLHNCEDMGPKLSSMLKLCQGLGGHQAAEEASISWTSWTHK